MSTPSQSLPMISKIIHVRDPFKALLDGLIYIESFFHVRARPVPGKRRVLIMRKDGLGDNIVFYPTLRAYREFYKDDKVTLLLSDQFESLSPLLDGLADKIIWFEHAAFRSFLYRRRLFLGLKSAGYDTFINAAPDREVVGFFMMKMINASERIGFAGNISTHGKKLEDAGDVTYTRLIEIPDDIRIELDRGIYFAEQVTDIKVSVNFPTIDIKKLPDRKSLEIISAHDLEDKRYAVIFPGAGAPYRIWQKEKWAATIDYLASKGIAPVVCGSIKEKALVGEILSLTNTKNAVDLSGKTDGDAAALACLLSSARLYFGSDTGVMHLSVAVGTPTIAIVGKGGLWRWFPYGDPRKNRAVSDHTKEWQTGDWSKADIRPGEIHPSVANIYVDDAKEEIDSVLEYSA